MLSIQIDTKSLELFISHQFNNIKLSLFASHMKSSFPLCTVIRYSRVYGQKQSREDITNLASIHKSLMHEISSGCSINSMFWNSFRIGFSACQVFEVSSITTIPPTWMNCIEVQSIRNTTLLLHYALVLQEQSFD